MSTDLTNHTTASATVMNPILLRHIITHLSLLLNRDFLLDIFTHTEKTKATWVGSPDMNRARPDAGCYVYDGKLLDINGQFYVIVGGTGITINIVDPVTVVSLNIPVIDQISAQNTPIILAPGEIANFQGDEAMATTMGRLLLNYAILVDPFLDLIPYINEEWKIGKIEAIIFELLRTEKITVEHVKQYSRNLHYIGHFTEISVPTFTEKSLTVNPLLIKRRDELLAHYHDEIVAGDVVVMNKIETELVALDRELLKGDESTLFFDQSASKAYGGRKIMYGIGGMVQEFGGKGYNFIDNSLEDGWKVKNFQTLCNEIRRGSYNRAKETAKGGEETKFLIRVFQNTKVTEEDCKSTNYLAVILTRELATKFLYRNIAGDGTLITLTADNLESYIGKIVQMRSPMYCDTPNGYCFTCMGELFRTINQEVLTLVATSLTSFFTTLALKSMHLSQSKRLEIKSLNAFVV
jgi:hypothetical protein